MVFFRANTTHVDDVAGLATCLWTDHDPDECRSHFAETLSMEEHPVFLCIDGGVAVGFAEFSIRHDYVEGTRTRPVGYVEGIYVLDAYRRKGIARALLRLGEQWAMEKGCSQMASDCELTNTDSLRFHLGNGFAEANRIICFVKEIDADRTKDTGSDDL